MTNESPNNDAAPMPVVLCMLSCSPLGDVGGSKPWRRAPATEDNGDLEAHKSGRARLDLQLASCGYGGRGRGEASSSRDWRDNPRSPGTLGRRPGWSNNDGPK